MALLSNYISEKKLDIRLVERHLSKELLSREELEKHLKKLPDDATNAEYINPENIIPDTN